jgi:hypothetical protein
MLRQCWQLLSGVNAFEEILGQTEKGTRELETFVVEGGALG